MWQAETVEPWTIGLVALVVVGLGVIGYGALADRAKNRRRAAAMLAPPDRTIPQFSPAATSPRYVSELQARRRPPEAADTDAAPAEPDSGSEPVTLTLGYASPDFVTDRARQRAVLDHPAVLVCADGVQTVRELLAVLEPALRGGTSLVVAAPALAPEVLGTLEVNAIQGKLRVVVVLSEDRNLLQQVADVSGASPVDRSDRQAGYVTADRLGHVVRWVSTRTTTTVTPA